MTQTPDLPPSPFTRATCQGRGISDRVLEDLVSRGAIRRALRGVYVDAGVEDTLELRLACARLALSRFVVVCDRTAAWMWGVDTFAFRELEILPPLETYALRSHSSPKRNGCYRGSRSLAPEDLASLDGICVTTPLRTAADLACKLGPRDALAALDGFMRAFDIRHLELQRLLVRYFRRRGVVQARALVPWGDPRAESPGESWTRCEILQRGIRVPELQWWVTERGRRIYRLDLAWPRNKVAAEYDGREFHDHQERREHDEARRAWLRSRGWTVIVVTKDDFDADSVDTWIGELRTALRMAA